MSWPDDDDELQQQLQSFIKRAAREEMHGMTLRRKPHRIVLTSDCSSLGLNFCLLLYFAARNHTQVDVDEPHLRGSIIVSR